MFLNWILLLFLTKNAHAWDMKELELFDTVEEINQNFYDVMGISQDAQLSDVKKAYRTLSKQIHPDKNDAPDAEVKFRELVSVYEVLRNTDLRARYNRILVDGLPDWRSPVYYYRRARKMSLKEIFVLLMAIISIAQYLMAWGSYWDRRHTLEDYLDRKKSGKEKKKRAAEDAEMMDAIEQSIQKLDKPSCYNILPIQLVRLVFAGVVGLPSGIQAFYINYKESKKQKEEDEKMAKEQERLKILAEEKWRERKTNVRKRRQPKDETETLTEEQIAERKKIVKAQEEEKKKKAFEKKRRQALEEEANEREMAAKTADYLSQLDEDGSSQDGDDETEGGMRFGPWADEELTELARLTVKFPPGVLGRWNLISAQMRRSIYEVTTMSKRVIAEISQRAERVKDIEAEGQTMPKVKKKTRPGAVYDMPTEAPITCAAPLPAWSPLQQRALEKALKEYPKGVVQRWDKIAKQVPEKTKDECMLRFKHLAELIRKKKTDGDDQEQTQEEASTMEEEDQTQKEAPTDEEAKCDVLCALAS